MTSNNFSSSPAWGTAPAQHWPSMAEPGRWCEQPGADAWVDPATCYVARADRKAGGKLIPGSRLSGYFTGARRYDEACAALATVSSQWPDAAVFYASNADAAERLLAADDPSAEWLRSIEPAK